MKRINWHYMVVQMEGQGQKKQAEKVATNPYGQFQFIGGGRFLEETLDKF